MPETSKAKDSRINLRITHEQKELLERAAALKGVSLNAYILFYVLPAAKQEVDSHQRLVLSNRRADICSPAS